MRDSTLATPRLDPATFVNDVLRQYPATAAVFNTFGIDACCGGARSVRDAAREDGADCCALLAALEWALADAPVDTPCAAGDVVLYAPDELHAMRAESEELLLLAT